MYMHTHTTSGEESNPESSEEYLDDDEDYFSLSERNFDEDSQPHDGQMRTLSAQLALSPSSRSISISSFSDEDDAASSAEFGTPVSDGEDGSRGSSPADFQQAHSPVNQQSRVNSPHVREAARHCIR